MIRLLFFFILLLTLTAKSVVSLDLNADQWVLSLVQPKDIRGVSPLAADTGSSYYAERAKGLPVQAPGYEALLHPHIKVVVATAPLNPIVQGRLKQAGIPLILLKANPSRREMDADFSRVQKTLSQYVRVRSVTCPPLTCQPPSHLALIYGQGGVSPGSMSYLSEIMKCAGYRSPLPLRQEWHTIPTEQILRSSSTTLFTLDTYKIPPALRSYRQKVLPLKLTLCPHPLVARALCRFMQQSRLFHG